jgi:hypothetical protein
VTAGFNALKYLPAGDEIAPPVPAAYEAVAFFPAAAYPE